MTEDEQRIHDWLLGVVDTFSDVGKDDDAALIALNDRAGLTIYRMARKIANGLHRQA